MKSQKVTACVSRLYITIPPSMTRTCPVMYAEKLRTVGDALAYLNSKIPA